MIPKTLGYTEIVKITEAALNGDAEKAIKYVNRFLIKWPESDLVYPFTHLLNNENNPSGLNLLNKKFEEGGDKAGRLLEKDNDIIAVGKCANCGVEYHIHAYKK